MYFVFVFHLETLFHCEHLSFSVFRPEDHRGGPDPVCEKALRCHDPDCVLSERVCPDWAAALYGQPKA